MNTSLRDRLVAEIAQTGPMTVAQYMAACLHDPQAGYYATRPALGPGGDFITAPLISQMFGELIGVWAASCWRLMGDSSSCGNCWRWRRTSSHAAESSSGSSRNRINVACISIRLQASCGRPAARGNCPSTAMVPVFSQRLT